MQGRADTVTIESFALLGVLLQSHTLKHKEGQQSQSTRLQMMTEMVIQGCHMTTRRWETNLLSSERHCLAA